MSNLITVFTNAFLEGYASNELNIRTMIFCMLLTAVVGVYICLIYKTVHKETFYNREFQLSLFAIAIITAAIILTIQSNIVVSLGMVGALSIVRFRTAVKNPIDLVFLFWSISAGIICGAGFAMIAVIASLVLTIGIVLFDRIPKERDAMILVVNADKYDEKTLTETIAKFSSKYKIKARNINSQGADLAIEVKPSDPAALLEAVNNLEGIIRVSLVEHDGEVTP